MIQGPPPEFGRITLEEDENKTLITYRWFHWTYLSHLTVGIIALIFVYAVATTDGVPERRIFAIVSTIVALVAGSLSVYVALTGIVNCTRLIVQDKKISVTSGPVPWFRDRPKEITDIVKIYNTERFARWKFEPPRVYPIVALIADGSIRSVLSHVYSELEATYVSEQIQRRLGLECKPYFEVLLDKLYEPEESRNPYFEESRRYKLVPEEMRSVIQTKLGDSKLIYRQNSMSLPFIFDVLDLQMGSGEFYMLTQVSIKPHPLGSEVTVKQKPKPYMPGTIGHSLNVRRFFGKIESAIGSLRSEQGQ